MIINNEKKFVFIAIPKTASKSVSAILGQHQHPEPYLYHMTAQEVLDQYPYTNEYTFFACVRNPWARLVSAYFDFTKKRGYQYSEKVRHDKPLLSEFVDFEDFCLRLKDSPWYQDIFFKPQVRFITDSTQVMRFEHLREDFNILFASFGISASNIEHINKGVYEKVYRDYYTKKSKAAILKVYEEDIDVFGYQF